MKLLIIVGFIAPLAFILFGAYTTPSTSHMSPLNNLSSSYWEDQPVFVEINQVPPPFDLAGHDPYVVWINGARVRVPKEYIHPIIDTVGKENIQPIDIPNMHEGWLQPHFFEQADEAIHKGRTRIVNGQQPQ
tara:strand:+ start:23786 stop:24181 length:396 start_codon:yes stop_codon:yes gene_type:complete